MSLENPRHLIHPYGPATARFVFGKGEAFAVEPEIDACWLIGVCPDGERVIFQGEGCGHFYGKRSLSGMVDGRLQCLHHAGIPLAGVDPQAADENQPTGAMERKLLSAFNLYSEQK